MQWLRMKHFTSETGLFVAAAILAVAIFPVPKALSQSETKRETKSEVKSEVKSESSSDAVSRTRLAVDLERKKNYVGMVELLEPHKARLGKSGLVLLARGLGKSNRPVDAIGALELANARFPKDAQLQTLLAAALAKADRKEESIAMYYTAKTTGVKYVPAYDGLLSELVKGESRQEARDLISDMMKRFGKKGRWVSQLCELYALDAFLEKAVETCLEGLRRDPTNPMNAVRLATTYREQGQPEKARKILVKTAGKIRKSEPVQTALGDYFTEKKNYVDAFRWYKAGVKNDPKSFQAQLGLAQAALELQKMEESVTAFTAACKLKRTAIREFQSGLIKIRNRGDIKWQSRFESAISESCQVSF